MTTNYPAALDTTTELPAAAGVGANLSTFPHSTLHGNPNDAIRAIEAELGVAPSDTFSTVKARLDRIELGWTSYTPTLTQSVTITKTVGYARWVRVGKMITGQFHMTATSAGTANNIILIGLPVTAGSVPNDLVIGSAAAYDASPAQNFTGPLGIRTTTSVGMVYGASGYLGTTAAGALTIASGDIVSGTFVYESAT